jgi:hypothetical protein
MGKKGFQYCGVVLGCCANDGSVVVTRVIEIIGSEFVHRVINEINGRKDPLMLPLWMIRMLMEDERGVWWGISP